MKKKCIVIFIIMLAARFMQPVEREIQVKIPVRVSLAGNLEKNLGKKDFKLYINGQPNEIIEFFAVNRSLSRMKLNRRFILAFALTEYDRNTAAAVSYFVNNILNESDRLLVWSPLKKITRIASTSDKKQVLNAVEKIFKEDTGLYKQALETAANNLENTAGVLLLNPAGIKYFIKTYTWQVDNFNARFVFPDFANYNDIASFLAGETGEKWLIHFQERQIFPCHRAFPAAETRIREYAASLNRKKKSGVEAAAFIENGLAAIRESMDISKSYPSAAVFNFFLGLNIGYHVVFTGADAKTAAGMPASAAGAAYERILRDLSGQTGGAAIAAADAAAGLQTIISSTDYYYDIVFKLDGETEDKEIKLETQAPGTSVFYKNKFTKEEINILFAAVAESGITISGDELQGYNLVFKVSGFRVVPEEKSPDRKTGSVQVEIRLLDDRNETVYQTGRTLKSSGDTIDISLRLPETYKGYFKLTITAVDSITGGKAETGKYIKLK